MDDVEVDGKTLRKARRLFWIGLTILIGPLVLWLLFITLTTTKCKPLMMLKTTNAAGDSIPHTLPAFQFVDQYGRPFGPAQLKGKYHVANFIFTTCPGICKRLSKRFTELQEAAKDAKNVVLVSYSVDPLNDTVPALAAYAKRQGAIKDKWYFVTSADERQMFDLIIKGYLQAAVKTPDGVEKVTHSSVAVLLDKDLRIRGFYTLIDDNFGDKELDRLKDEINVLECEYRNAKPN